MKCITCHERAIYNKKHSLCKRCYYRDRVRRKGVCTFCKKEKVLYTTHSKLCKKCHYIQRRSETGYEPPSRRWWKDEDSLTRFINYLARLGDLI